MWKSRFWKKKDKWLFVLTMGAILCILAIPSGKKSALGLGSDEKRTVTGSPGISGQAGSSGKPGDLAGAVSAGEEESLAVAVSGNGTGTRTYEQQLEMRVKNILKNVDGVGKVDVMIALYASSEKVIRSDTNSNGSLTEETDSSGGTRRSESNTYSTTTVMEEGGGSSAPVIEKEVYPEISGIVISAEGGGDPKVRSEIAAAMEALFGLPAHKIKVLKRAG